MVRILSCHHFRGQRIGRCEEAVGVAVAGDVVIVALDHQINVYGKWAEEPTTTSPRATPSPPLPGPAGHPQRPQTGGKQELSFNKPGGSPRATPHEFGTYAFLFQKGQQKHGHQHQRQGSTSPPPPANTHGASVFRSESLDSETELRLSHTFPTIDQIDKISYNEKGKYILCLEKREGQAHSTTSVRSYFHWERDHGSKPMRARIAGLVSPTGAEPEDDSLMMVEVPLTSPATAVSSCDITGHIACLSAESIINIFLFRAKEVTGRVKVHYYDFDRTYACEVSGFVPEKLYFLSNYLACMNSHKIHVFRLSKDESPVDGFLAQDSARRHSVQQNEKVVFDPKNESIRVYLPSILRSNRKRKSHSMELHEEFQEEINTNHTRIIFSANHTGGLKVHDVLRVGVSDNSNKLTQIGMYPIRIKDHLGAVALMVSQTSDAFLYHLPTKADGHILKCANYHFTAPLISFSFDSLFFHALTETGLESYTNRSLYYAIKDMEGIQQFVNDCPLHEEEPSLIGIRPFVNVRKMACNNVILCMLASSLNTNNKHAAVTIHSTATEETASWTIYTLDLPDIEMIYDDMLRTAQLHSGTNPESHFVLLCEAYIVLKIYMESHPEAETAFAARYKEICKLIGLGYLKSSVNSQAAPVAAETGTSQTPEQSNLTIPSITDSESTESSLQSIPNVSEELVDQGVTYLLMGRCGVQEIFSPENWGSVRERNYIHGFVRMIEVTFLKSKEISYDNRKLSPTLAPIVVEFLANNGPNVLVDLVIEAPFIRECNSKRLIHILQQLTETTHYRAKETLALFLTLVTVGGVELNTRLQVKELLNKTHLDDLSSLITYEILLEKRGQQTFLKDIAVCLIASDHQELVSQKLIHYLKTQKISVSVVMFAFAQAVNVNTDNELQHCITKSLISIIEAYIEKLRLSSNDFGEEDKRATQLLVRTYLSSINFSTTITTTKPIPVSSHQHAKKGETGVNSPPAKAPGLPSSTSPEQPHNKAPVVKDEVPSNSDVLKKNQLFGNICTSVNYLLSINSPNGFLTPQSQSIASVKLFINEESREIFIKLLSLMSTPQLSNLDGVKDIILSYLYKNASPMKPTVNSTLYLILQIFGESTEKAVNLLINKQPTTLMLFAKETFEKAPLKWKTLVASLKKKIQSCESSNITESEIYLTILESVYLHLANCLTPQELEQVLDKETEESSKFHGICKRVHLANNYANMVISVSSEYLTNK